MDLKIAARMIAVLAIGAAMIAAAAALREAGSEDIAPATRLRDPGGEPATAELVRCRDLGMAAADDAACLRAWAEHRRRFFETGVPRRPADPKPERFGGSTPSVTPPADPSTANHAEQPGPATPTETESDEAPLP